MATQVQNRRGTTAEHSTFTGANGELTVDTTKRTLVVHDGATAGGRALLREDQSNLPTSAPTTGIYNASGSLAISTNGTKRIEIQADGDIDIDNGGVFYDATNNRLGIGDTGPDSTLTIKAAASTTPLKVSGPSSEFLRCDQQGRLLVGTSSTSDSAKLLMQGNAVDSTGGAVINLCNGKDTPVNGEATGIIRFSDNTHAEAATIMSARDGGTWSGTSKPSRLTFSVTPDSKATPEEAMRIKSSKIINFANAPTYADNAAATAGGLVAGDVYKKADGTLMITF